MRTDVFLKKECAGGRNTPAGWDIISARIAGQDIDLDDTTNTIPCAPLLLPAAAEGTHQRDDGGGPGDQIPAALHEAGSRADRRKPVLESLIPGLKPPALG